MQIPSSDAVAKHGLESEEIAARMAECGDAGPWSSPTGTEVAQKINLDRRQTSIWLGCHGLETPVATLHKYAFRRHKHERGEDVKGEIGPSYVRYGNKAVYNLGELEAWLSEKLKAPGKTPAHERPGKSSKRSGRPKSARRKVARRAGETPATSADA